MKNIVLILSLVLLVSCSNTQESKTNADPKQSEVSTKNDSKQSEVAAKAAPETSSKGDRLKQQGSYAALFDRAPKDCGFVSREILAEALQTPIETIVQGSNECTFHLEEQNGDRTRFYFVVELWGNDRMLKDIEEAKENAENFGKDSKLSQYKISETGDTYLSMHQNRMVRILNETTDTAIAVFYSPETDPEQSDLEKKSALKDKARERAYAIANYLLKKYQK